MDADLKGRRAAMTRDRILSRRTLFMPHGNVARGGGWAPLVDVYRTLDGWLVKCDLAGIAPEDVTLSIHGNRLTIRGVRRDCCLEEGCSHYVLEIAYSHFERTIELPEVVDRTAPIIEFRQGMLLIRIPTEATR
jgi:HSP20 family protein